MKQSLAKTILSLVGWKVEGTIPLSLKKCIVVMAPHTSNWDFVLGWLGYSKLGLKSKYLIKKEAFRFPLGALVRKLGGIPVDRKRSNHVLSEISLMIRQSDEMILTVTPEGTRSLNRHWKRGFYYLAQQANVPLALGFLDYKTKTGGIGPIVEVTGDFKKDMEIIEAFYRDKTARYPEKFNLSPQYFPNGKEDSEKFEII